MAQLVVLLGPRQEERLDLPPQPVVAELLVAVVPEVVVVALVVSSAALLMVSPNSSVANREAVYRYSIQDSGDTTMAPRIMILMFYASAYATAAPPSSEDFGKATLKGVSSYSVKVTFDSQADVKLTTTTEQVRAKIESVLKDGGLNIVASGGEAELLVQVLLPKAEPNISATVALANGTTVTGQTKVTFWVYRIDCSVRQRVMVKRPIAANEISAVVPTWRMINSGIIGSNFDEAIREVIVSDQLKRLISDSIDANK